MGFLTELDYKSQIKDEHLAVVTGADPDERIRSEAAALGEMKSYLRTKYDTDKIFIDVRKWDENVAYIIGDHVIFNDRIYNTIVANTNKQPDLNTTEWSASDLRDQTIIMFAIDMVLYHLHSSINPRDIPALRKQRYDGDDPRQIGGAIGWLRKLLTVR